MIGVIGGLGPRATAIFYLKVMNEVAQRANGSLPRLVMYSVAMNPRIENAFLRGDVGQQSSEKNEVRKLLREAVKSLTRSGAEIIVMPCNTLQEKLAEICVESGTKHLDMIDETIKAVSKAQVRRILVLGTSSTCQSNVYGRKLRAYQEVSLVYPDNLAQREIERMIRDELDQRKKTKSEALVDIVRGQTRECDGVVIACTDLSECISEVNVGKPVFDSLACLADGVVDSILADAEKHLIVEPKWAPRSGFGNLSEEGRP